MIYIHIKKGVPEFALDLLVKRIIEHGNDAPTRILKKHNRKGKFAYTTWVSTKALSTLSEQGLFTKLMKLTRNRTRSVTLLLRQKTKDYGHINALWDQSFSLL